MARTASAFALLAERAETHPSFFCGKEVKRCVDMDPPRNIYGERCQFDAYRKLVPYHEAIDYLRSRGVVEPSFSDLPQMEVWTSFSCRSLPEGQISAFSSHGYDPHIENEL